MDSIQQCCGCGTAVIAPDNLKPGQSVYCGSCINDLLFAPIEIGAVRGKEPV